MSADDLNDLAAALGRLRPAPAADRDVILYRAGFRAGRRAAAAWPLAAAAASALALAFGALWLYERGRPAQPQVVVRTAPRPPEPAPPPPGRTERPEPIPSPGPPGQTLTEISPAAPPRSAVADKRELEDHLIRWGLDGLTPPGTAPSRPVTVEELLRSF